MGSFGQYLLKKGVLDLAQLEEATHVMVVFGGRLGTILVEAGYLTLEDVEKHLSAFLDVPCAPRERLAWPDPEALAVISRELAQRHSVLPLWIEKRTLHLAMLDPRDPNHIDALAFSTDLAIVPYVIGERRLVELLEQHYGLRPDPRFTDYRILEMAGHYRPARRRGDTARARAGHGSTAKIRSGEADEITRERVALGIAALAQDEELSDPAEAVALHGTPAAVSEAPIELTVEVSSRRATEVPSACVDASPAAPRRIEPARDCSQLAGLEAELIFLAERDRIASLALRIAAYFVRSAALFVVRDPMIQGVLAAGDVRSECIEGLFLPLASDSMLSRSAERGTRFRGKPAAAGIDADLLRALRERPPRESIVLPVCLADRCVNLLYADNGDEPLAETSIAALEALGDVVSAAYRRLILLGKRLHC